MSRSAVWVFIAAAPAFALPFQFGDIFISGANGNVYRFNLPRTIGAATATFGLAFDNSGNLYVATGSSVQKFDNSGNPLGSFAPGFPGSIHSRTDMDFDSAGNAYPLLATPGTTDVVTSLDTNTLALGSGFFPGTSGASGDVEGLAGAGLLMISPNPVNRYDSGGHLVFTYNTVPPAHGTWIGVDLETPSSFWAVTDFGEVNKFDLGTSTPVTSFSAGVNARGVAVCTNAVPEPSAVTRLGRGMVLPGLLAQLGPKHHTT